MDIFVFLILKLFFLWAILTIFEVIVINSMKVSTFKYLKLLKFLEIFYVILTIVSIDFYLHIGTKVFSYLIYSLFIMIYFGILIYDFWKKKITKKDLHNMTGVSNSTITKMSNNKYVSLEVLERICKSLECDLTDIVEINCQIEEEDHD